jgi:hypothetical protein
MLALMQLLSPHSISRNLRKKWAPPPHKGEVWDPFMPKAKVHGPHPKCMSLPRHGHCGQLVARSKKKKHIGYATSFFDVLRFARNLEGACHVAPQAGGTCQKSIRVGSWPGNRHNYHFGGPTIRGAEHRRMHFAPYGLPCCHCHVATATLPLPCCHCHVATAMKQNSELHY